MRRIGRSPLIASALLSLVGIMAYGVTVSISAVTNGSFVATWSPSTDSSEEYEFRWRHFASAQWIALPIVPGTLGVLEVKFPALPSTPTTDRWLCLDARMVKPAVGPWLSDAKEGPACNVVEVGVIPLPTPPAPVPPAPLPTPPAPVPPAPELFMGLTNSNGLLTFTYRPADCPRGVQQSTGALINGARTLTLRCRR